MTVLFHEPTLTTASPLLHLYSLSCIAGIRCSLCSPQPPPSIKPLSPDYFVVLALPHLQVAKQQCAAQKSRVVSLHIPSIAPYLSSAPLSVAAEPTSCSMWGHRMVVPIDTFWKNGKIGTISDPILIHPRSKTALCQTRILLKPAHPHLAKSHASTTCHQQS